MDGLLTPVSTTYLTPRIETRTEQLLTPVKELQPPSLSIVNLESINDALDALRSKPGYDDLITILKFLAPKPNTSGFSIHVPGPKSAAVVQLLVTEIAPNYWALFTTDLGDKSLLLACLRSVAGINALLSHIRVFVNDFKTGEKGPPGQNVPGEGTLQLGVFLDLLAAIFHGSLAIKSIWESSTGHLSNDAQKRQQSQALLTLMTSGRLLSLTAEATTILRSEQELKEYHWVGDGNEMSRWICQNVIAWAKSVTHDHASHDQVQLCTTLFQRGLSLGYPEQMMKVAVDELLLSNPHGADIFRRVCLGSTVTATKVVRFLLVHLSRTFLDQLSPESPATPSVISAAAGIIKSVLGDDESMKNILLDWCTASSGAGLGHPTAIRRAVLSVLAPDKEFIVSVFEKSLSQFGDELYIKHAAVMQQNVHAEVLLLSAGYVFRISPVKLAMTVRSGLYLSTISNRIASTQPRLRFLGMVVGECLSHLVDMSDKRLDFHLDETEVEEAKGLKSLTTTNDTIGPIDALLTTSSNLDSSRQSPAIPKKKPKKQERYASLDPTTSKAKPIIEVVDSSDDNEDNDDNDHDGDLVPYKKNEDPEDSDEDPTLVQRNKIRPPVYIRDLITFLRDSESYDKQKLGLETASDLIRRKANYGSEVSSHAQELASLLVGIQDKFELENFGDMKLQAIVALIVSQPKIMAPWFARTFFEGDFSLSQRTSILVALGVAARELGTSRSELSKEIFASKRLPEKIEQLYLSSGSAADDRQSAASRLKALPATALDTITKSLAATFLEPITAEAADAATGPDVLKLQTFTARHKSKLGAAASARRPRVRAIPNTVAAVLFSSFFLPLTGHFQLALRSARPVIFNPTLLGLYLQTLGIVAHAGGPSTLALPQLTSELWDLLLRVRQHVLGDLGGLRGWLVAAAALLEVNGSDGMQRMCRDQGREIVEAREWVSSVFERTRGGDGGEENDVKMLAAGVLIRLGEVIEKYQTLLMGDLIGFS